jgi:adenosylmethionine-8-amino-7-oxononanoate aminotransferase
MTHSASATTDAIQADLDHIVHPFTPANDRQASGLLMIDRADGLRLWDTDGKEYLDAKSGLMNVNVGWGREELGRVAGEAVARYGYASLFFGHGHVPAAMLGRKLAELTPGDIDKFFLTVGGSDANETAIKVARMYHAAKGSPDKFRIIARDNSYHGMSMGATSLTGSSPYWEGIGPRLPGIVHIPQPDAIDANAADVLEQKILELGPETVAAFIAEPISNAAGVNVPGPDYWPAVARICERHGVLLIMDEVITGFGRTGRMFACEHWGLEPDMIVMSKGVTSGYQPLGAVGFRSELIDAIGDATAPLLHGFTAGGHPAACAVALANLDIMEREGLVENAAGLGEHLREGLQRLSDGSDAVGAVRGLGFMMAVDLVPDGATPGPAQRVEAELIDKGMLIRRWGDTIILGPCLNATKEDIDEIVERLAAAIEVVTG